MVINERDELIEAGEIDKAIAEAERQFEKDGILLDAREVLSRLRKKHFGCIKKAESPLASDRP